ncbi:MAG: hydantoinase B/oxoprolinase family protein [Deltaproteobacteria bacterium]|nr:hydantoinase B/oxoprolinase family protein [Deltaproteobacteria bacterium]MBW2117057.1 hydantoinase B/oxoprolinase family protein [Deltaproteobacteria bacterium]
MNGMVYGRDMEVVQRLKPEPLTSDELVAQEKISDVDFEIFNHKMNMIAQEGKETTMKLGASSGMRWGDVAFGVYTSQGDLSVVATGIWFHAVLGQIPVKYIIKHWIKEPSVGVDEGDSFFWNDPFYGGVHGADMGLCVPVYYDGKLVCFTGAVVHTGESGGSEPGGLVGSARSKYDEGLLVPPIKIGENYALKEDILNMFSAMNRDPRTMILDIKARLAACRIAQRRIVELIDQKGLEFFAGALRRILTVTAEAAKKKVRLLNDGVFRQPRFMDTVGPELALTKINVTLTKKDDKIKLTFKDTTPMLPDKPLNTFFQGIIGLTMVYFCGWFFHDLPANNGLLEILEWEFPENSLINAQGDVPTSVSPFTQTCFAHGMFLAGARMTYNLDPLRAVAAWFQGFGVPIYGGMNQWNEPIADITPEINATGAGARPDMDGVDGAGAFFATMSDCSDVETTESDRPFLYLFRNYFKNSYGHGKFRGGAGVGFGMMMHHVPWVAMGSFGYGSKFPSTIGIFGGYAVPPTFIRTVGGSNVKALLAKGSTALPNTMDKVYEWENPEQGQDEHHHITMAIRPLMNGDTFYLPVGGGAGYGDALEREPEAVLKDLRDEMTTHWAAQNIYKIVYDEQTLRLDSEKTEALRVEARAERLRRAKPYDEFEAEWLKLRPSDEVIKYYGAYPNPSEGPPPGPPGM